MCWRDWLIISLFFFVLAVPAFVIVAEIEVLGRHVQLPPGVPGPLVALAVLWGGCLCVHDAWRLIGELDDADHGKAVNG